MTGVLMKRGTVDTDTEGRPCEDREKTIATQQRNEVLEESALPKP